MTVCEALLKSIPKDIKDRQWVIEAAKVLRKHDKMQAELERVRRDYDEACAELDQYTI